MCSPFVRTAVVVNTGQSGTPPTGKRCPVYTSSSVTFDVAVAPIDIYGCTGHGSGRADAFVYAS